MAKSPDKDQLSFSNGFYDDDGTMSEMDTQATGFQRGGRIRASLPISRMEANKSKEKPLGLVYLNYMSETKRALMPNEVTGIDTVKALFVRAFPRALTMAMLDSPQRKIYIRDPVTEIFYELENLDEVKDRVVLKIYEPGYVEETTTIHNSTSTPIDLNVCSDSELADIELPDFRERSYNTVGSKPAGPGPDRFDPHMRRPNSTTPMEMSSSRRMHPQQGRGGSGIPHRSPPGNEPFQRGVPERSTAPVRQGPFSRSHKQRMSTLPRSQDGRRTPTNAPRSMTMPRPTDKGQVYRPHPENAGRPVEQRIQSTVQTTTMASSPGYDPARHPPKEHQRDPNHPQHRQDFQPPRASTPQQGPRTLDRGMGPPRGPPQRSSDMREGPNGPRSGPPPQQQGRDAAYRDRSVESPRRQPPPQGPGSPVKAPRGEMRNEGPPYPRQQPPPDMQTRSPTRNAGPGMRQPPPGHMQQPGPNRPHDRTMERPRDRSMERPRSTPPQRMEPRGHGPPPMKHPHPPQANLRDIDPRAVRQGPGSVASSEPDASDRISVMEQQIASLAGMVRSALKPGEQHPQGAVPPQQRSPQRRPQQRPSSERVATPVQTPNRSKSELTGLNEEVIRATQNQKTFTSIDSFTNGSDSQSVTPQPMAAISSRELRETTMNLKHTVKDLRDQLKQIRKLQLNMVQDMNVAFRATNRKVQLALRATPAGNEHPIRSLRTRTHQEYVKYQMNRDKLDKQIRDLESAVEEMRDDVVTRQCHVNLAEVDGLAQAIGNSSKHIAEQKVAFPMLADKMKTVMQGEMEIVVMEENFIKDEPGRLDDYMKRCKKVTGTLCTLKRLASVQEHRTPAVPVFEQKSQPVNREAQMDSFQKISPDHKARLRNIQAAEESRQRNRQFNSSQEIRRFQTDLGKGRQGLKKTQNVEKINQRRRTSLKELYMSEDHDALTPILTPEKMAKQATLGKKKVPPPPPPKRTHLSQQAVATHSSSSPTTPEGAVSASPPSLTPQVVVTVSSEREEAPAIPPKPAMMVPKSQQQVDDPSSARSTPDLSCMSSSISVNSECLSSPVKVPQSSCALSQSGFKSEPLLAISENVQTSMINPQQEVPQSQKVRGPSATSHLPRQVVAPIPGTVMTSQSSPMRSNGGQAVPRSGPISPQGVTSPRGVVTPEGGVMLSQGAVMIAKSGSATSPGLATTPQRQAPVRLLSSSSQGSPSKMNSPTSPQIKQSSIPVLKRNPNSRPGGHHVQHAKINDKSDEGPSPAKMQTLPNSPPEISSAQRRSSAPSNIDIPAPPKPPRGCVDAPVEPTDSPPKSAFRPLAIPGWKETSLDEVPLKRKTSDKPRRHTVTLPQHQKRNGWVPSLAEHPANGSPRRHQPDSQSIPLLSPPKGRPVVTIEPNLTPLKMGNLSKSQPGTDSQLNPEKKSTLQRQNSDPGSRPAVTIVDKKGALKIQQLKEQYAKLRKLQEEQKMMEHQNKEKQQVQQGSPQNTNQKQEGTSTDLKAKTLPSTTLEVDVSYSQGEASKSEDQDESSSYTKQTVIYRVGPKPFQIDGQKVGGSPEDIETGTVVSSKREIIADSVPVSNGLVHQPVFSQLKSHEMAPRNFATKAKPVAVVNGNGVQPKTSPTATTPAKTDTPAKSNDAVITNGGGKLPLTNGGTENIEGQGEKVIERTEKEVDKQNALNVSQNGKAESKTVYTKRLEETFIF